MGRGAENLRPFIINLHLTEVFPAIVSDLLSELFVMDLKQTAELILQAIALINLPRYRSGENVEPVIL